MMTPQYPRFHVAQQDDSVHVAWKYDSFGVKYSRSLDGGRTWPLLPPALPMFDVTGIACAGGLVIVAGIEEESFTSTRFPRVMRSADGGATWDGPISLFPSVYFPGGLDVHVHIDGQNVVCVWVRGAQVWSSRSTNGGLSWQGSPTLLGSSWVAFNQISVIADGPVVHVFWHASYPHTDFQQTSTDCGLTWLSAPRTRPGGQFASSIAGNANDLYVAAYGATVLDQSHDGGVTWTSAGVPGMQNVATVVCGGQTVLVAGSSTTPTGFSVTLNVSTDGGTTWQSTPWTAGASPVYSPFLYAVAGDLYAHFRSEATVGDPLLHSHDLGATWRLVAGGADTFAPGPRRDIHLVRVPAGTAHHYAVYTGTGYTTKGTGIAGTGGIAPQLRLDGLPHLGATTSFTVDAAVGGALGALGFAFAAPAATPFGPATIWLQGPLVLATLAANGTPGAPGAGNAALPVAIPASPSLVGANLTAQALLLDAGAAAGFTVTNAIEVWMR